MRLTLPCFRCGQPAATFALLRAGEGEGTWRDRDRLERAGFMGTVTQFGSLDSLTHLFEAIRLLDYQTARQLDADLIAFHCWKCGKDYCEKCWRVGPPKFDEGFYDCTPGTCPEGHEQTVDD